MLMLKVDRVKQLLDEHGRTRKWLARECGLEVDSLKPILTGRRQPGLPVLKLMALAFNVSLNELIEKEAEELTHRR